jgi:hypothetical protein
MPSDFERFGQDLAGKTAKGESVGAVRAQCALLDCSSALKRDHPSRHIPMTHHRADPPERPAILLDSLPVYCSLSSAGGQTPSRPFVTSPYA